MPAGKRQPQGGGRYPSLRGVAMVDTVRGSIRIRSWPAPRPGPRHPTNEFWSAWLKGITYVYRYQPARVQWALQEATRGTIWMPRDIFISASRGRAFLLQDELGRKYHPMPFVQEVSESLDAIAQLEGQMMYRGANLWLPIAAGVDGDILRNVAGVPTWQAGAGGGSSYAFVPVYKFQAIARTTNVNSVTYIAPLVFAFHFDCDQIPFNQFRLVGHGNSTQAAQTVDMQLAQFATPATPLSAAGNDFQFALATTTFDTDWIDVPTPLSGFQQLVLAVKGSNATVDLSLQQLELHLRVN